MAQHHALRRARSPARVEETGEVVFGHVRAQLDGLVCREQVFVGTAKRDHVLDAAGQSSRRAVGDQHARARIAQGVFEFGRGVPRIEGHHDQSAGRDADVGFEIRVAVDGQDRHPVAVAHAECAQPGREPGTTIGELRVAESQVAVDDGGPPGGDQTGVPQRVSKGIHGWRTPDDVARRAGPT
jgi:hypothetical protein